MDALALPALPFTSEAGGDGLAPDHGRSGLVRSSSRNGDSARDVFYEIHARGPAINNAGRTPDMPTAEQTRAVVVDSNFPGRLRISPVPIQAKNPTDVTVRVTAISLNRGEVKRALMAAEDGWRPGWDFTGIVEDAVAQGSGPKIGARVVGMLASGAWAERIRAPSVSLAEIPEGVTEAQAATLPVAGLTALHALRKGGLLLGRKVLIDGASGGVGHLAVQLAKASGAIVYGHVRREDQRDAVVKSCTGGVVIGATLEAARASGPYDLILDSVGGTTLAAALTMLRTAGTCVTFGVSEAPNSTIESGVFFRQGGVKLYGLILFDELMRVEPAGEGLSVLLRQVQQKLLVPQIEIEAPWTEISKIAQQIVDRKYLGKAVLRVG
jgi:NADPH:quinone reductase